MADKWKSRLQAYGYAKCVVEPKGQYGLEGYNKGELYMYHWLSRSRHSRGIMVVWACEINPEAEVTMTPPPWDTPDYVLPRRFKKFFEIVKENWYPGGHKKPSHVGA